MLPLKGEDDVASFSNDGIPTASRPIRTYEATIAKLLLPAAPHTIFAAGMLCFATQPSGKWKLTVRRTRNLLVDRKNISKAARASGYPVKSVSMEGSCYKAKALTARGAPADVYFNPATGDAAAAWISVD